VDDLARSSVHSLCPEMPRSPMLIEHFPSHLHERAVLSFHNAILWGSIRSRKLVIKTQVRQKASKQEFLNSPPLSLRIALIHV
jgi:hypothetical protein